MRSAPIVPSGPELYPLTIYQSFQDSKTQSAANDCGATMIKNGQNSESFLKEDYPELSKGYALNTVYADGGAPSCANELL